MGTITKTIGSAGGRDYSTVQAWEDALPANLVTDGNSYVGQCFNDSEFLVAAGVVTIAGETTDATHTITLTTGAGQSIQDNANAQTNALRYNVSNGVGFRATNYVAHVIQPNAENVFISKIQFKSDSAFAQGFTLTSTSGSLSIDQCLFESTVTDRRMIYVRSATINNSLIRGTGSGANIRHIWVDQGTSNLNFCTLVTASDVATKPGDSIRLSYATLNLKSCAVFGATAVKDDFGGSPVFNVTTCMTDVASPPTGFTGSKTYANQFQNTTISSGDYREKAGADLQGAGTSDTTNGANDIVGTARPQGSNWDIGCWELIAAAASTSSYLLGFPMSLIPTGPVFPAAIVAAHAFLALRRNAAITRRRMLSFLGWPR